MIITSIEKQKNNSERYNIYIDNEYRFSLDIDLLYELKLKENMTIDIKVLEEAINKVSRSKAFNTCIKLLSRTNKTEYEIRKKLMEKNYNEDIIQEVINKLKELNYVNDESYVDSWIRSRVGATTLNRKIIYNKLAQKGIDKDLIQEKIENNTENNTIDEYTSAYNLAQKKLKSVKGTDYEIRNKLLVFLYNKGFDRDTCYKVVDKIISE